MPATETSPALPAGTLLSIKEKVDIIGDLFPGPVFVYRITDRFLKYTNVALRETLGYSAEDMDLCQHDPQKMIHPDDVVLFQKGLDTCSILEGSAVHTYTCRLYEHDRGYTAFQLTARILRRDDWGQPISIIVFLEDMSHRMQYAAEVADLERKLDELTMVNKELEEFAYIASHDMHEPLRKVHSFASRLKEKYSLSLEEEAQNYLDRIVAATQNARHMIDGLMEFSRLSRNGFGFERVQMNTILADALSDIELKIEETQTHLTVEDLPRMMVIPVQIKQLFTNIILNAIKFSKEDSHPHIIIQSHKLSAREIAKHKLDKNSNYYQFNVTDNGIGFEAEYASTIFQMFQRLNEKHEYPGSGIGLALCKKIVDNHHGLCMANGTLGQGTTISFILPEENTA